MNSRNVPGEVVQSDKLSQTKCNEFLDNFVIKKARIVLCSAYTWFDDCSFLFLYTYFNNDSISEI